MFDRKNRGDRRASLDGGAHHETHVTVSGDRSGDDCNSDDDCRPYRCRAACAERHWSARVVVIVLKIILALIIVVCGAYLGARLYAMTCEEAYERGVRDGKRMAREGPPHQTDEIAEGGPCRRWSEGVCEEAEDVRQSMRAARYYLHLGDAESALERWSRSRRHYRRAIEIGSPTGSQASIYAAKRIQFQSMTCNYDQTSLARISRDYEKNSLGALIKMKQKQQALRALGYYNGEVDNQHSAATRAGVRSFQADLWFDQTGVLTAEQTVLLICGGAQIAKDVGSQNMLGIMNATGLGVRQNTDFALNWLEIASQRGDADASWNLAMMYGTRTVLSSVLICDAVQNEERADSYLDEAVTGGHPAAKVAKSKFPRDDAATRWRKLRGDLNAPEAVERVGRGCNPNN
ncbi:MAG: peptidoglycan-binding protein [Parvularculaceae bacterium]